jgi:plastocyanin
MRNPPAAGLVARIRGAQAHAALNLCEVTPALELSGPGERSRGMRLITYALAAAVLAVGASAVYETAFAQSPAPSPAPSAPAGTDSTAAAKPVSVDTKDFAYAPASVTVPVGTKVIFKNSDPVAHTVTSDDKLFDSKDMNQGTTWAHVFDKAGTYKYTCAYHSYMHGTVIVK